MQRSGTVPGIGLVHAPFSLLPSPFPRQAFSQAIELAPLFNLLADRVSQDAEFLQQTLARYIMSTLQKKKFLDSVESYQFPLALIAIVKGGGFLRIGFCNFPFIQDFMVDF